MEGDHRTGLVLGADDLGARVGEREDLDVGRPLGEEVGQWTEGEQGHVGETEGDEVGLVREDVEVGGRERGGGDVEVAQLARGEGRRLGEDRRELDRGKRRWEGATWRAKRETEVRPAWTRGVYRDGDSLPYKLSSRSSDRASCSKNLVRSHEKIST